MHLIENSLGEFYEKQVALDPDHEFVVYPDRNLRFTYGQFDERANNLTKGLLAIGIKTGDHVGIWAKNVPDWFTFMFATAKIGAVLITVNTTYKSHEVEYILKQSNVKTLALIDSFQDVDYLRIIYGLLPELKNSERGRLKSKNFPCLKSLIYIGQEKHRGMFNSSELMLLGSHYPNDELRKILACLNGDNVINMQYTSGTTGFPKGVMLTSKNILNNGLSIGDRQKFNQKDRVCLPVPLFHCFGIVLGVMAVLTHRATLVMLEVFDPLLVLDAVQKERCTALYGVPTMFIAEYNHPMFNMFDLSSLRTGIMAGSICPVEVMKKVMRYELLSDY